MRSPPAKDGEGGEKSKKRWEKEVKWLQIIVDYLKNEQSKNPSQSNQDKLKKAEDRLKDLENNPPQSPNKNKDNPSSTQPSLPRSLIIGGIIALLALSVIGILIYKKKKNS